MGPLARNGLIYCWFIQKILQFGSSENFNDKLYTDWCYPSLIKRVTKYIPPNIYLLKGNKNTTKRCEICSKLNNKNIGIGLVFLLLNLNILHTFYCFYCRLRASRCQLGPGKIYLLKVNNRNTKKGYEIYSKLTIKTPERRQ